MAEDATNKTEPSAGFKLSGEASREAAIKRLKKKELGPNTGQAQTQYPANLKG